MKPLIKERFHCLMTFHIVLYTSDNTVCATRIQYDNWSYNILYAQY